MPRLSLFGNEPRAIGARHVAVVIRVDQDLSLPGLAAVALLALAARGLLPLDVEGGCSIFIMPPWVNATLWALSLAAAVVLLLMAWLAVDWPALPRLGAAVIGVLGLPCAGLALVARNLDLFTIHSELNIAGDRCTLLESQFLQGQRLVLAMRAESWLLYDRYVIIEDEITTPKIADLVHPDPQVREAARLSLESPRRKADE